MGARPRQFDAELSADPTSWVGQKLSDLEGILAVAGVDPCSVEPADADERRATVPEIQARIERMLERIRDGELARAPVGGDGVLDARNGWL